MIEWLGRAVHAIRFWRCAFWAYAVVLFTVTHWPALTIDIPRVERPDLFIHFACFGTWAGVLVLSQYTGPLGSWRALGFGLLIALAYAAFDETLQLIPIVRRHFAFDDMAANMSGVTLGIFICIVVLKAILKLPRRDSLRRRASASP